MAPMNLRIKELADEAFVTVSSDGYFSSGKFCEKFAELIVLECVSKLDDIGVIDRDSRTIAMKVISEHFGVEE
jgi:hypothetical protein